MTSTRRHIPIYTTSGLVGAYLYYPHIFNIAGEWIGWVTREREVYSVLGHYVGWLSDDPRILRKRSRTFTKPRKTPPKPPTKLRHPVTSPLPPMMRELPFTEVDVLDDEPERLSPLHSAELRNDME
ncbi:MAG: 4-fold beta flower protein [Chloroflexota bacterium]